MSKSIGKRMNIFDSHCHLDDRAFQNQVDAVIANAHQAEVNGMMVVGIDADSSRRAVSIANRHDWIFASVGVHPHDAQSCDENTLGSLRELADDPKVKAWGETGLDFNRMHSPKSDQEKWFLRQLEIGDELGLPMIFHERDSDGRFLELLTSRWHKGRSGVVHCFSGSADELKAYLELDLYIGVTGILTIKSRGKALREMVRRIPTERLLVETDAPYLTPTPERNKHRRNEPAFVRTVVMKLAQVRSADPGDMATVTWDNACRLFGLP